MALLKGFILPSAGSSVVIRGAGVVMTRSPKTMIYYDIHTHHVLATPDVVAIVNTLIGVDSVPDAVSDPLPLFRSVGIHPCYIDNNVEEQLEELRRQAAQPRVVAIGETGLDKRAATPLTQQMELFRVSADLSEKHSLPLIIHCVRAWDELIALRCALRPRQTWIIHGFRGGAEQARQLLRQGFLLSFGEHFHPDAVRAAYPDHLFAETDERGTDIRTVYAHLADTLRLPLSALIAQLACNVHTHFSL